MFVLKKANLCTKDFHPLNLQFIRKGVFSLRKSIRQGAGELLVTMKRRQNDDPDVRISKEMSRLLRHKPPPGAMDEAGWMSLPVLLRHMRNHPTEEDVRRIVETNDKVRCT